MQEAMQRAMQEAMPGTLTPLYSGLNMMLFCFPLIIKAANRMAWQKGVLGSLASTFRCLALEGDLSLAGKL